MSGYKHPCRYCDQLVPPDANTCPICGKMNPIGPMRCPKCRSPIQQGWKSCSKCGLSLEILCPQCAEKTFFGDYCEHCDASLMIICPHKKCQEVQYPLGDKCIKCGKPLKEEGGQKNVFKALYQKFCRQ